LAARRRRAAAPSAASADPHDADHDDNGDHRGGKTMINGGVPGDHGQVYLGTPERRRKIVQSLSDTDSFLLQKPTRIPGVRSRIIKEFTHPALNVPAYRCQPSSSSPLAWQKSESLSAVLAIPFQGTGEPEKLAQVVQC
jgi:hypothetical protein